MVSEVSPCTWVYYNKIGQGLVDDISPGKKEYFFEVLTADEGRLTQMNADKTLSGSTWERISLLLCFDFSGF
jgi:hypothetical protein